MKTSTVLFAFAIIANIAFAQTSDCNCNELFDKNIKTEYSSFSAQLSKEVLYKYFTSDQKTRQSIKNDNSIEGSVKAVINAIPLDIGFGSFSSSSNNKYYYMYQQAVENKYISDELLESLYVTSLPDKLFDAYEKCLSSCPSNVNGIFLRNISTQDDLVVLEMRFKSVPAGAKVMIKDAVYSSGSVVGGKKIESGTEITDGQVIYEHIKVNPDEPLTVTISFDPGIPPVSFSYSAKNKIRKSTDAPLGTIVASLLNYNDFLKLNGLEYESDVNKVIWAPCDGRPIGTDPGTYGAYSGGKAPDLRGLFLRSVNDMGAYVATVPTPKQENLNPESKQAGQIQMDAFQGHKHLDKDKIGEFWSKQSPNAPHHQRVTNTNSPVNNSAGIHDAGFGKPRLSTETRPKNISVYYYIKIR